MIILTIPTMRTPISHRSRLQRSARPWRSGISRRSSASITRCASGCLGAHHHQVQARRCQPPHRDMAIIIIITIIMVIEEGEVGAAVVAETPMKGGEIHLPHRPEPDSFTAQTLLLRDQVRQHIYMETSNNGHGNLCGTLDHRMQVELALVGQEQVNRYAQYTENSTILFMSCRLFSQTRYTRFCETCPGDWWMTYDLHK